MERRLGLRLRGEQKAVIQRAGKVAGRSLASFATVVLAEAGMPKRSDARRGARPLYVIAGGWRGGRGVYGPFLSF